MYIHSSVTVRLRTSQVEEGEGNRSSPQPSSVEKKVVTGPTRCRTKLEDILIKATRVISYLLFSSIPPPPLSSIHSNSNKAFLISMHNANLTTRYDEYVRPCSSTKTRNYASSQTIDWRRFRFLCSAERGSSTNLYTDTHKYTFGIGIQFFISLFTRRGLQYL